MSRHSIFVSRQSLVKAKSFYVAIEFGLGRGFDFMTMSRQRFSLSRSRRSRQEIRGCDRVWSRLRNFLSRQRILVSRQIFLEWCHDRVFSVATGFGQDQEFFLSQQSLSRGREFMSQQSIFVSRQSLALDGVLMSR